MKKRSILAASLLVSVLAASLLFGCSASGEKPAPGAQTSPVETVRDNAAPKSDGTVQLPRAESTNDYVAPSKYAYDEAEVDVDLTSMSSTAVYSAVYQMMADPKSYQDQVVKMRGIFYSQHDDSTDRRYYFVVVQDATACCAQGIEFVWDDGEHAYPDDYPAEGAEVVACGRFGTYAERSSQFAYLSKSSLQLV